VVDGIFFKFMKPFIENSLRQQILVEKQVGVPIAQVQYVWKPLVGGLGRVTLKKHLGVDHAGKNKQLQELSVHSRLSKHKRNHSFLLL